MTKNEALEMVGTLTRASIRAFYTANVHGQPSETAIKRELEAASKIVKSLTDENFTDAEIGEALGW